MTERTRKVHSLGAGSISLCTIVKDEEQFIGNCLESLEGAVDEKIIVDTGSSDRTIEIAESYGAKVFVHPWRDSFSEARNYALQFAAGEWILHLDADEELEREDITLLRKVVQSATYNAVFMPILNYLPDGNMSKFYYRRLFRRGKGHYRGIVHNQIIVEGESASSEIRIYHHGYNLSPEQMAAKQARSEKLLLRQLDEDPDNLFARFNLARIYRNTGKYQEAIIHGTYVLSQPWDEKQLFTFFMALFDLAYCLMNTGEYAKAEQHCLEGLQRDDKNLDITFTLATIYAKQERFEEAITTFRRFLKLLARSKKDPRYNMNTLIIDSWSFEDKAQYNIGQCYLLMGEVAKGERHYRQLLSRYPEKVTFYKGLALWYMREKQYQRALELWRAAIDAGIADGFVYFKTGELLRETGELREAASHYEQALESGYRDADLHNSYGFILLNQGRCEEALEQLLRALELSPQHVGSRLNLLLTYRELGDTQKTLEAAKHLFLLECDNPVVYKEGGNVCVSLREFEKAIGFYEKYLRFISDDTEVLSNLAGCYAQLGHYESAKIGYRAVLTIDPECRSAKKNLDVLEGAC